jgi:hypothetical protein
LEVKLFGPTQLKVNPPGLALKLNVDPTHTGALLVTIGVAGVVLTVTAITVPALPQPDTFTLTV